ncbi:hypothetical protein CISIN_1g036086mg [Citrus sinensis]|uniref:NB-ARC domain-containing protein n=1 Tax=Citrus sinensis TaxID=2711 RepID=A0A067DBJ9_CITSI|nr:hypothetical protein CISIN_1g036086mg [Citrus sinensis]
MADKAAELLDLVCGRLDSQAGAFWNNGEMKRLRLNLRDLHNLLRKAKQDAILNPLLTDLNDLASDVDGLIDARMEVSKYKFEKKVMKIHQGRLVPLLNSLQKIVAGHDVEGGALSQRSGETGLESSVDSVKNALLRDGNTVRFIHIVGVSGTDETAIAHRVFTDDDVKSRLPFKVWYSVGKNLDFSTAVQEIRNRRNEIPSSKRLLFALDDVSHLNDDNLANLRLLVSDMRLVGFYVLVTTHSTSVATMMMQTVPEAEHLIYFSESNSWSNLNCELPPSSQEAHRVEDLETGSAMDEEGVTSLTQFLLDIDPVATGESLETVPTSDRTERRLPIHDIDCEAGPFQNKDKVRRILF